MALCALQSIYSCEYPDSEAMEPPTRELSQEDQIFKTVLITALTRYFKEKEYEEAGPSKEG